MKKLFFLFSFLVLSFTAIQAHTSYGSEDFEKVNSLDEVMSENVTVDFDSQVELIYTYKLYTNSKPCNIQATNSNVSKNIFKEDDLELKTNYEPTKSILEPPVIDLNCLNYKNIRLKTNVSTTSSGGLPYIIVKGFKSNQ